MKNVFIIGSKGIPSNYGGFETFVEELTNRKQTQKLKYHVSCMGETSDEFIYNNARCFNVKAPNIGSAKAILYDIMSLQQCIKYISENRLENCIVYILACRIGPFFSYYKKKLEKTGAKVFVNPDGHEWKRSKWSYFIRLYWKNSEKMMIKKADLIICDSKGIEQYIKNDYRIYNPSTTFIPYGADVSLSSLLDEDELLTTWFDNNSVSLKEYYLIVGRFVPENNYELMIKEFMKSDTTKDLVIISNVDQNDFYNDLVQRTNFVKDSRIKFVGTVYNQNLLKKIREQAYGYIHGHEVGGTNPSLLEALASTNINLLLDVVFNKEVGESGSIYFSKEKNSLAHLINTTDKLSLSEIKNLGFEAKKRIVENYSWDNIIENYEQLFLSENNN